MINQNNAFNVLETLLILLNEVACDELPVTRLTETDVILDCDPEIWVERTSEGYALRMTLVEDGEEGIIAEPTFHSSLWSVIAKIEDRFGFLRD